MKKNIFKYPQAGLEFFLKTTLAVILMYSMVLCLYITGSDAEGAVETAYLFNRAMLFLENIICSVCLAVITAAVLLYRKNNFS